MGANGPYARVPEPPTSQAPSFAAGICSRASLENETPLPMGTVVRVPGRRDHSPSRGAAARMAVFPAEWRGLRWLLHGERGPENGYPDRRPPPGQRITLETSPPRFKPA